MDVLTEADIVRGLEGAMPDGYLDRLRVNLTTGGTGRVAAAVYLVQGGRRHPVAAHRLGAAVGMNIRLVDDLLDGDLAGPVEDRARFLGNYRAAFDGADPVPVDVAEERLAYAAGRTTGRYFSQFPAVHADMRATMERMRERLVDEDLSTREGYLRYLDAAGGDVGELVVEALQALPDLELTPERRRYGRAVGRAGTLADHLIDMDVPRPRAELERLLSAEADRLRRLGGPGTRLVVAALSLERPRYLRGGVRLHRAVNRLLKG